MTHGKSGTVEQVVSELSDSAIEQANEAGVDVEDVAEQVAGQYSDSLAAGTLARFAESEIDRRAEAQDYVELRGLVAGSRDRTGKNWPRRFSLLRSDDEPVEVSSWDGSLPDENGNETEVPGLGTLTFLSEYEEEYDSHNAQGVADVTPLPADEAARQIAQIAKTPGDVTPRDEYSIVAIRGTIMFVEPQTVFRDGENVGDGEVLIADERGVRRPHLEIGISQPGADTLIRGHLEEQRYGEPVFEIEDGREVLEIADERHDTPAAKASMAQDAFKGREVIVVGNVNNVDRVRDDNGDTSTYVDVAASAIVEVPDESDDENDAAGQQPTSGGSTTNTPPTDSAASGGAQDASDDAESEGGQTRVGEVAEDIEAYATLTGTDVDNITVTLAQDNLDIDAPESVVEAALTRLQGEPAEMDSPAEAPADGSDDAGGGEPALDDDGRPTALQNPDGTWACPACYFSGPWAGLLGHVQSEHAGDDPKAWLVDHAEGA